MNEKKLNSVSNCNTKITNLTDNEENFYLKNALKNPADVNFVEILNSKFMAEYVAILCDILKVSIDRAGVVLLQNFFKKFLALWKGKKKITYEKLSDIFLTIFHKQKHCTQTKENVLLAGDIACDLCIATFQIENVVHRKIATI